MLQFKMVLLDGAKIGILCQNRQQNVFFSKYLSEGVTPPSKILHAHSTSDRE